jgi:hypothetical protein
MVGLIAVLMTAVVQRYGRQLAITFVGNASGQTDGLVRQPEGPSPRSRTK